MRINLTPEQEAWLKSHFAISDETSVEMAARAMLDERIAEWEADDLDWAMPQVEEGLEALARGDSLTLDEHKAHIAARIAALKG